VRALPASWTDVVARPPFIVMAEGRAHFRTDDLLRLADLIAARQETLKEARRVSGELRRRCKDNNAVNPGGSGDGKKSR